jgi:hypothetical protein
MGDKWFQKMIFEWFVKVIILFSDKLSPKHINVKIITFDECESVLEVGHYNNF